MLYAFGVNHHTAPLAVRERIAFPAEALPGALLDLTRERPVREAAILSTCNRTELYCATEEPQAVTDWMAHYHRLAQVEINPYLTAYPHRDAVRHVFRVASGLDSMVLGENQILGQMKDAVRVAEEVGTLGATLNTLFQRSFSVAKEVRSSTAISANIVSMAAAAVHLSERIFERVSGQRVLFIGAGEMIDLCATHFAASQPKVIAVANRTIERAHKLAGRFGGESMTLEAVGERLAQFDIVVSCTGSPLPILGLGTVERALKARRHRPIVMVDLAVPRDIEAEVAQLDDVFLYSLDDLSQVVAQGVESRQAAVVEAEAIIGARVENFLQWIDSRGAVPTIRALRDMAERVRRNEIEYAQKRLARGDDANQVVEDLSRRLANKLLHAPTQTLNQADTDTRTQLLDAAGRLFHLHPDD